MPNSDTAKTKSAPNFLWRLNAALVVVLLVMILVYPIVVLSLTAALIRTDNGVIHARVVRSDNDLQKGLSGKADLDSDAGMLFVLPKGSVGGGIWMKDMRFAIDIIWLDQAKRVIDVRANTLPDTYPEVFFPKSTASYVLEVPAGAARRFSIDIGDKLRW